MVAEPSVWRRQEEGCRLLAARTAPRHASHGGVHIGEVSYPASIDRVAAARQAIVSFVFISSSMKD